MKKFFLLCAICASIIACEKEPVGALPGKFTINAAGDQIVFAQGNLQYQASTGKWQFAANQYDMVGAENVKIAADYDGWIDLFGWGTGNNPTLTSADSADYATFTDWGVNPIVNGGNKANVWRSLTKDEMDYIYLKRRVIDPFYKLKSFAVRIAGGNLDTPLDMDKGNVFGPFTESFDIMREELKASHDREQQAVKSRKELVAQLSHDIKTPVASIKAMTDVMSLTADDETKVTINAISNKADQIDALISNLFHATLEELEQLEVKPSDVNSTDIVQMIKEADYLNRISKIDIKDAVVYADKLRLNQVISNIIFNSYKYAKTEIIVSSRFADSDPQYLMIEIADKGPGVPEEELEMITQKFKRGSNAGNSEGSGLGLYISDYLMKKMDGSLTPRNTGDGFAVEIGLKIS